MFKLTNDIRSSILDALEEASYSNHLDISQYMKLGITHAEIGIIDLAKSLLQQSPNLTETDLIQAGISKRKIDALLGGLSNIKMLLGLSDIEQSTLFLDWIGKCPNNEKIIIPYWLYVEYQQEIRSRFTDSCNLCKINDQQHIYIQLDHGISLPALPLTRKKYAKIPINNAELIGVVCVLLSMQGFVLERINNERSVITAKDVNADERVVISVSCWSSKATTNSQSDLIICVIDDFLQENVVHQENSFRPCIITLDQLLEL
ncbi:hypothetical protein L4D76_09875 [Photobacterium sagamiensis]|uniref:hypothetical protein n=1 Tax=Photobacterium sagamiensis TaxID=2910241 RepID=UPI003D0D0820